MNNKAVIYVRVSSKDQEEHGYSIPAQERLLKEYAERRGLKIVCEFKEAETAKKAGRTAFNRMLRFLKEHPDIQHILVEKTDRLYRNFYDYAALDIDRSGIAVHLVKEGEILSKDSNSHQKMFHGIKVVLAKGYVDNLSEEVKKGHLEKASRGMYPSKAPLGYRNDPTTKNMVPDPQSAPLVRLTFELMATGGFSLAKLKRELYRRGLRSGRAGKELSKSAMQNVLTNTVYCGEFEWSGKRYQGRYEPLISWSLFNRVQEALGTCERPKAVKNDFPYAGLLKCANCGCAVTAEEHRKPSGRIYVYYRCANGRGACGKLVYLPEAKLEAQMVAALENIRLPEEIVEWTRKALLESAKEERAVHDASLQSLQMRHRKLQNYIDSCYQDKLEGRIDTTFWQQKTDEFKREQREILEQMGRLQTADTKYLEHGVALLELAQKAPILFRSMTSDEKREILRTVLLNPSLKDGTLEYEYKKPFSLFEKGFCFEEWRERRDLNPRPPA